MCGIAGFIDISHDIPDSRGALKRMTDALSHRGPDDEGQWIDREINIGLGHRRLSIIDLSPEGHQPMWSVSRRFCIVFNGEIYNYKDLRKTLDLEHCHEWRGHSDTEVILAAVEAWGIESAVAQFVGMFAIALWDREKQILYLVRDRLGEKPLYYGWTGRIFLFGSELKALKAHPAWQGKINRNALALYLRHNYIPAPYSIYTDIYKLTQGSILSIKINTDIWGPVEPLIPIPYWSIQRHIEGCNRHRYEGTDKEATSALEDLLRNAVAQEMVADVPLGAFLSGGVDSSTIVALMQTQSNIPVKTFTIGFHEPDYNEAEHAKRVAQHLKTDHTELYVSTEEAMSVIPKMPQLYDEPFSDSSQIPTFLVSQLARKYVTVSLSGDGGDELFGGYNRYIIGKDIWSKIGYMPFPVRRSLAIALGVFPVTLWNHPFRWAEKYLLKYGHSGPVGDKLKKLAEVLSADSFEELYRQLLSHWKNPDAIVLQAKELPTALTDQSKQLHINGLIERMMYLDTITYLPDDILVKVDRAAMAVSLETRVPLLDHRLVEFAWRLPMSMKIRNGERKWLLRQVLYKYVPRELIDRPKTGFGIPIGSWLRGPLKDWAEELLNEKRLQEDGFFNSAPIRQKWTEHLSGKRNWQYYLWDILMFQAWLDSQ